MDIVMYYDTQGHMLTTPYLGDDDEATLAELFPDEIYFYATVEMADV